MAFLELFSKSLRNEVHHLSKEAPWQETQSNLILGFALALDLNRSNALLQLSLEVANL
jgi:hypothetical protein